MGKSGDWPFSWSSYLEDNLTIEMETEWSIQSGLLLLDTKLLADVHVVHHQLVGRVDDTPTNLILSSINLVIFPSDREALRNFAKLTFTVSSRPPEWASLASMIAI